MPKTTSSKQARKRTAAARRRPGRVRIVATIGPASCSPTRLRKLAQAGMDVARINMSHGSHDEHARTIAAIRELQAPVSILMDLGGPKVRTRSNQGSKPIELRRGKSIRLTSRNVVSSAERISVAYSRLSRDLQAGNRVLLDDGKIELRVMSVDEDEVVCRVVIGGALGEHKGVHVPGDVVRLPSPTPKDRGDLAFGLEHGVDFVALSFVRQAKDVKRLRRSLRRSGADLPIFAKLETKVALDDLEAILDAADGVMVARGDLGLDLSPEDVPHAQKRIIHMANRAGRPVITATQMLESMTHARRPTRAEATDVANAVLDGTDAVMLSGETAVGDYPEEAVAMMERIIGATEAAAPGGDRAAACGGRSPQAPSEPRGMSHSPVEVAIARAAAELARDTEASALAVFTLSGSTARWVARERPPMPIYALTPSAGVARQLALVWGVRPVQIPRADSTDRMVRFGERALLDAGLVRRGDRLVAVGGEVGLVGGSRAVRVSTVGD